jgi:hypothetical protein
MGIRVIILIALWAALGFFAGLGVEQMFKGCP